MKKQALGSIPMKREIKTFEETKNEGVSLASEFLEDNKSVFDEEIENMQKVLNISDDEVKEIERNYGIKEDKPIKKEDKPSVKANLKEGYTRKTFAISDKQIELILAICKYKGIEQKELLEALIQRGLDELDNNLKEEALKYYKSNGIDDLFN